MRRSIPIAILALVVAAGACESGQDQTSLQPVTFMAGFSPQANLPFVGVYVADARGYFEEEGLSVDIRHSGGGAEHIQLLASGEVDITTQDAAVLLQRRAHPGLPLVSIGLIGQSGQQAFVALESSGIATPADWVGRTVGFKGTPPPDLFAILDAVGVDRADIDLVNVGFDPRVLTEGEVDVYPVFKSNEPNLIRRLGFDVVMWEAADYGIPTLGLAYVTTESTVENDPQMLHGFMRAVTRGISHAKDNPEQAIDVVMTHVGENADRDHQMFIMKTELDDARSELTDSNGLGWQTTEQWQALADLLSEYDALPDETEVAEAFTTEFLP